MINRRAFLLSSAAALAVRGATLTSKERIDRVLAGKEADRPPFTFWYHFQDEKAPASQHAKSTLDFHRRIRTDLVKVMSDYPYPKPAGEWFDLKFVSSPFPQQIEALKEIRAGLNGEAYFLETIFNPINVAEKLSSKEAVERMKTENPQGLLDGLEAIAKSQASHATHAMDAGAAGVFLAIANSADPDYAKFSEPFDRMVLNGAKGARLNVLHIHGSRIDLTRYYSGWPAAAINYSLIGTGMPFADVRKKWNGILMGGVDEAGFRKLDEGTIRAQVQAARQAAGAKYIVAGGCSVPNDTTDQELTAAAKAIGA